MDRAERRRRTRKVQKNRQKIFNSGWADLSEQDRIRRDGRCKWNHPLDCGHTDCYCCHYSKLSGEMKASDARKMKPFDDDVI